MGTCSTNYSTSKQQVNNDAIEAPKCFTKLNDDVYELCSPKSDPAVELVFFHGVQLPGSVPEQAFWRTWKMKNSEECWPATLLPELLKVEGLEPRVLSVSYEASASLQNKPLGPEASDEYLLAENLIKNLILDGDQGVGQRKNVPVILVGHDLGGVMLKSFVLAVENQHGTETRETEKKKLQNFLISLRAVFFYATPVSGSPAFDTLLAAIPRGEQNEKFWLMEVLNARAARENSYFEELRNRPIENASRIATYAIHAAHATTKGEWANIVVIPEGSARQGIDEFLTVGEDHFGVCQPKDRTSSSVLHLVKCVEEAKKALDQSITEG